MGGPENVFIGVTIRGGTKRFIVVDNPTCTVYEEHMVTCVEMYYYSKTTFWRW